MSKHFLHAVRDGKVPRNVNDSDLISAAELARSRGWVTFVPGRTSKSLTGYGRLLSVKHVRLTPAGAAHLMGARAP